MNIARRSLLATTVAAAGVGIAPLAGCTPRAGPEDYEQAQRRTWRAAAPAAPSALFNAIAQRQSTRAEFDGKPVSNTELRLLEQAGTGEGVHVTLLTERSEMENVLAVEVSTLRPEFAGLLGLGNRRPDLVVRFGRGPLMPRSLRRPVQDVLA